MKVSVCGCRKEEAAYFSAYAKAMQPEIGTCTWRPTPENAQLCQDYKCTSVLSTPIDAVLLQKLQEVGVRLLSTRTVGYDHIGLAYVRKIGIHIGSIIYASESAADYTIMLILMVLHKMKLVLQSAVNQDYSFDTILGSNLRGRIPGVTGMRTVGRTPIRYAAGLGCRILAYNPHPRKKIGQHVTYMDLNTLCQNSDTITLHVSLNDATCHLPNEAAFARMKLNVIIVNTIHGPLIDNTVLIAAIESGKVDATALDVVEGETSIYYS